MKAAKVISVILLFAIGVTGNAQQMPDDIKRKYETAENDSLKSVVIDQYLIPMEKEEFLLQTAALSDYFKRNGDEVGWRVRKGKGRSLQLSCLKQYIYL